MRPEAVIVFYPFLCYGLDTMEAFKNLSTVFRAKYVHELRKSRTPVPQEIYDKVFNKDWVVYAKQQFHAPKYVVEYLGRYTHKIAISNYRIRQVDKASGQVSFTAKKNYNKGGKKEVIKLSFREFTRRFSLHILPRGFTRIRHFGILSSAWKKEKLPALQKTLTALPQKSIEEKQTLLRRCTSCKKGKLHTVMTFGQRGPPHGWKEMLTSNNQL